MPEPVSGLTQQVRLAAAGAQRDEPPARLGGQVAGQGVIGVIPGGTTPPGTPPSWGEPQTPSAPLGG